MDVTAHRSITSAEKQDFCHTPGNNSAQHLNCIHACLDFVEQIRHFQDSRDSCMINGEFSCSAVSTITVSPITVSFSGLCSMCSGMEHICLRVSARGVPNS